MNKEFNNISQSDFERIERYIRGDMPDAEQLEFEEETRENPDLKEAVEEIQSMIGVVEEETLRERLDMFHEEMNEFQNITQKGLKKISWPVLLAAASVLLIVSLGVTWLWLQPSETEALFSEYYSPDPGLLVPMSAEEQYEFYRAMVDYKTGDYEEAIKRWNMMADNKAANDTLGYFLASAYLANEQPEMAIPYFLEVAEDDESLFQKDAYWYLGLIYLEGGNSGFAKKYLQLSDHPGKRDILSQINQ